MTQMNNFTALSLLPRPSCLTVQHNAVLDEVTVGEVEVVRLGVL
jgi:hypothetical protein